MTKILSVLQGSAQAVPGKKTGCRRRGLPVQPVPQQQAGGAVAQIFIRYSCRSRTEKGTPAGIWPGRAFTGRKRRNSGTSFSGSFIFFKARANLSDYLDLNRRYIKTSDAVLFGRGVVALDVIPKYFFASAAEEIYRPLFCPAQRRAA